MRINHISCGNGWDEFSLNGKDKKMEKCMFNDNDTNTIFVTDALKRYSVVYAGISDLETEGISIKAIPGTENVWARDFMPLQVNNGFVKFGYKSGLSDYDFNKYPQLVVPASCYAFLPNLVESDIVLDGGNCQRCGGKALISEIIFQHNPKYEKDELVNKLSELLKSEIVLIPVEPNDDLGHTDGILKFIDENTVFINDYRIMGKEQGYDKYLEKLTGVLTGAGLDYVFFPYAYNKQPKMTEEEFRVKYPLADDFNPAIGYYINFLLVGKTVLAPLFGIPEDTQVLEILKKYYPEHTIKSVDCFDLAMEGGLINCVTMNYKI